MNIRRLRAVQKAVLKHPGHFNMAYFFHDAPNAVHMGIHSYYNEEAIVNNCGTTACIAGWAVAKFGKGSESAIALIGVQAVAIRLLDLTLDQAERLFHQGAWDDAWKQRQKRYVSCDDAKAAVEYIDYFIEREKKTLKEVKL